MVSRMGAFEPEPVGRRGESPHTRRSTVLCCELLLQKLRRALVPKCPHRFVVAPDQMLRQLPIQILHAAKAFPSVEIPLVVSMASFNFSIMPRRSRRNQFVCDPKFPKCFIKRTFLCFTDILVGEFRSVISLDCLNSEWENFYQHT